MSKDSSSPVVGVKPEPEAIASDKLEPSGKTNKITWSPWTAVILTILVYYAAQFVASILIILYPKLLGWNTTVADNWINNSVAAQFFYVLFAEALTFGAIWWFIRWRHSNLRAIGWKKLRVKDPFLAIAAYVVYYIAFAILLGIVTHIFPSINVNQKQQLGFQSATGTFDLVLTFMSLCVLPPLVEETVFRGFVFTGLRNKLNFVWSAIFTSILFASAHLELGSGAAPLWVAAIDTFTLSLVLCFLREKTDRLWPGIFLHALKNSVAFITLFILHLS